MKHNSCFQIKKKRDVFLRASVRIRTVLPEKEKESCASREKGKITVFAYTCFLKRKKAQMCFRVSGFIGFFFFFVVLILSYFIFFLFLFSVFLQFLFFQDFCKKIIDTF